MRNPLTLAWWILLLGVLEGASLFLDQAQHLLWGRIGILLLKVSYLAFAGILLLRFLSFRSRKPFEAMVDSYHKVAGLPWASAEKEPIKEWRKLLFHMGLIVIASTDLLTAFGRGDLTFKSAIALDLIVWLLALRWVVRAYWLKAQGRREKLKEGLDNARSRFKTQVQTESEDPSPKAGSTAWQFLVLFLAALLVTLAMGAQRWRKADQNYRIAALKGCLMTCLGRTLDRFHEEGRLEDGLQAQGCLSSHREDVDIGQGFQRGELLLWAVEKPGRDYFGNGKGGDQGLMLDAEGRFRDTGRR